MGKIFTFKLDMHTRKFPQHKESTTETDYIFHMHWIGNDTCTNYWR